MTDERRDHRYAIEVEAHVRLGGSRMIVTQTRDLSERGLFLFVHPPPEVGDELELTLFPRRTRSISIKTQVKYRIEDIGVGLELRGGDQAGYFRFFQLEAKLSGAWSVIGDFVKRDAPHPATLFDQKELVEVGERCEMLDLLFEHYPPVPFDSVLSGDDCLPEFSKNELIGVTAEPIEIKLHRTDRLRSMHLGVLEGRRPTYVALTPSVSKYKYALYALKGRELLTVRSGQEVAYPKLNLPGLSPQPPRPGAAVRAGPSAPYEPPPSQPPRPKSVPPMELSGWTAFGPTAEGLLTQLFDQYDAENRTYCVEGREYQVRLLRNLRLFVRAEGLEYPGILFHDGSRLCLILDDPDSTERVRPFVEGDELRLEHL